MPGSRIFFFMFIKSWTDGSGSGLGRFVSYCYRFASWISVSEKVVCFVFQGLFSDGVSASRALAGTQPPDQETFCYILIPLRNTCKTLSA
jgi:hypothetical protein